MDGDAVHSPQNMQDMRSHAQSYADLGYAPVPVRPNEKVPAVIEWTKRAAPTQEWVNVNNWSGNLGLLGGNDVMFIDFDAPKDGTSIGNSPTFRRILAKLLPLIPRTKLVMVETPGKGVHIYKRE